MAAAAAAAALLFGHLRNAAIYQMEMVSSRTKKSSHRKKNGHVSKNISLFDTSPYLFGGEKEEGETSFFTKEFRTLYCEGSKKKNDSHAKDGFGRWTWVNKGEKIIICGALCGIANLSTFVKGDWNEKRRKIWSSTDAAASSSSDVLQHSKHDLVRSRGTSQNYAMEKETRAQKDKKKHSFDDLERPKINFTGDDRSFRYVITKNG